MSKKILTDSAIPTELKGMMIASNIPAILTKSVFSGLEYSSNDKVKSKLYNILELSAVAPR